MHMTKSRKMREASLILPQYAPSLRRYAKSQRATPQSSSPCLLQCPKCQFIHSLRALHYSSVFIIMQGSAKAMGSRILEDRTSIKVYISGNNTTFNEKIAIITNKDYSGIKDQGIFEHTNNPNPHIFYFRAQRYQSQLRNDVQEYIIKELHHFHNNYDCSYAIAYVHSSFFDFLAFRRFIEKWPEHFFYKLRRIYIVNASLMVKFIETCSFGTFYRLCDQLFLNIAEGSELGPIDEALMASLGENPKNQEKAYKNSLKIIESEIYGKTLMDYDLYTGKYPIIILRLLSRMLRDPKELQLQGIFRKSCDSEELQRLQRQIQAKHWQAIDQQQDILTVCGCFKKVLNNLKLPLFNYKIYDKIISYNAADQLAFIRQILAEMEYVNKKVFVLVLVFLTDYVIAQREENKMNGYNLSVVFGPCFFRPMEYDLKDLIYSGKFAKILVNCFQKQEQVIDIGERMLAEGILKSLQDGSLQYE